MRIIITGGGSGGHFYPLISVVDQVRKIAEEKKIIQPKIYYFADKRYDDDILFKKEIEFVPIVSGKLRRGGGIKNFFLNIISAIKVFWGTMDAFVKVFQVIPDVVFTNGGYISFPVIISAKILRIPVVIHVSDTVPSRVLLIAGKFATKISLAFPEAKKFFPGKEDKIAYVGNPVRLEIQKKQLEGAYEYYRLDPKLPTIWVLGGSQGSKIINDVIVDSLNDLLKKYQIIHQVGRANFDEYYGRAGVVLLNNKHKERYKIFPYLNNLQMKMAAGAADLVISRAGAGSIYEIANWNLPSIMIPISKEISRDQESNALAYARSGSCVVIRQKNLTHSILLHEIDELFNNPEKMQNMIESTKKFFIPGADKKIALLLLDIMLEHEI